MEVEIARGESFESLLRRFKKIVKRSGILSEVADRRKYGAKPSVKKRFKKTRAFAQAKRREKVKTFFEKRGSQASHLK
jgi:ribosomal protein S21